MQQMEPPRRSIPPAFMMSWTRWTQKTRMWQTLPCKQRIVQLQRNARIAHDTRTRITRRAQSLLVPTSLTHHVSALRIPRFLFLCCRHPRCLRHLLSPPLGWPLHRRCSLRPSWPLLVLTLSGSAREECRASYPTRPSPQPPGPLQRCRPQPSPPKRVQHVSARTLSLLVFATVVARSGRRVRPAVATTLPISASAMGVGLLPWLLGVMPPVCALCCQGCCASVLTPTAAGPGEVEAGGYCSACGPCSWLTVCWASSPSHDVSDGGPFIGATLDGVAVYRR